MHYLGSRIKIFIYSMSEPHQSEIWCFIFSSGNHIFNRRSFTMNSFKHVKYSFVGSSVERSPERPNTSRNTSEGVSQRTPSNSDCWSWGILFMFRMTDPNNFKCFDNLIIDFELFAHRVWKHHIQKIFHIAILFFGMNNWQPLWCSVSVGGKGRHFCD